MSLIISLVVLFMMEIRFLLGKSVANINLELITLLFQQLLSYFDDAKQSNYLPHRLVKLIYLFPHLLSSFEYPKDKGSLLCSLL